MDKGAVDVGEGGDWVPGASTSPAYDADGNLTHDGRWDYVWNGENRLIRMTATAVAVAAGHPRLQLEFAYDWQGRRIQKVVREDSDQDGMVYETVLEDRRFVYDGWNLVAEYAVNGTTWSLKNSYLWGLDLSGTEQGAGGVGGLLLDVDQSGGSAVERFPAYDGNGNIIAWIDDTAMVTQRNDYDPFGNLVSKLGEAGEVRFGFSTKYTDAETKLFYYGYRYYNPEQGRWLNRDPINEEGGLNLYAFGSNSTVNGYDVLGLKVCTKTRIDKTVIDEDLDLWKVEARLKVQYRATLEICDDGRKTLTGEIVAAVGGRVSLPGILPPPFVGIWSLEVHGKANAEWNCGFKRGYAEADIIFWLGLQAEAGIASVSGEVGASSSWDISVSGSDDSVTFDAKGNDMWLNGRVKGKIEAGWVDITKEFFRGSLRIRRAPDWQLTIPITTTIL